MAEAPMAERPDNEGLMDASALWELIADRLVSEWLIDALVAWKSITDKLASVVLMADILAADLLRRNWPRLEDPP